LSEVAFSVIGHETHFNLEIFTDWLAIGGKHAKNKLFLEFIRGRFQKSDGHTREKGFSSFILRIKRNIIHNKVG
jgi:hypothetical protein